MPAVHRQIDAGDVNGGIAEEKHDRTAEISFVAPSSEKGFFRIAPDEFPGLVVAESAGGQAVDPDAGRTEERGEIAGEIDHAAFVKKIIGRNGSHVQTVGEGKRGPDHALDRADIDDRARTLIAHDFAKLPVHEKNAGGIDSQGFLPLLQRVRALHGSGDGVVHLAIHAAEFFREPVAQGNDGGLVALIALLGRGGESVGTDFRGDIFARCESARGDDEIGPGQGEIFGEAAPVFVAEPDGGSSGQFDDVGMGDVDFDAGGLAAFPDVP